MQTAADLAAVLDKLDMYGWTSALACYATAMGVTVYVYPLATLDADGGDFGWVELL